jgi:hypothetical protein
VRRSANSRRGRRRSCRQSSAAPCARETRRV